MDRRTRLALLPIRNNGPRVRTSRLGHDRGHGGAVTQQGWLGRWQIGALRWASEAPASRAWIVALAPLVPGAAFALVSVLAGRPLRAAHPVALVVAYLALVGVTWRVARRLPAPEDMPRPPDPSKVGSTAWSDRKVAVVSSVGMALVFGLPILALWVIDLAG